MFEIIKCGKGFTIYDVKAEYFPFLVNLKLEVDKATLYEVNSYLRAIAKRRNGVDDAKRVATTLCRFLNYLYYQKPREYCGEIISYFIVDENLMHKYQTWLKANSSLRIPDSRNIELKHIYRFYWYLENTIGCIDGVIGISDAVQGRTYSLPVRRATSKHKTDFIIPILEREITKQNKPKSTLVQWESSYKEASSKKDPLSLRDALIMKVIMDTAIRREELNTLTTNLFSDLIKPDNKQVYVTLNKSKFDEAKGVRTVPFPVGLYKKIKMYIRTHRTKLLKEGIKDERALFLSNTGRPLCLTSVNYVLKQYELRPHDGRKLALTEMFIDQIRSGHEKEIAIMNVAEVAGHSPKSNGKTLEECYLIAYALIEAAEVDRKNAKLEDDKDALIHQQQSKIEELESKVEKLRQQHKYVS